MPHFPLTNILQKAIAIASKKTTIPKAGDYSNTRRQFIRHTAIAAGGSMLVPNFLQAQLADKKPTIAIIGAGMAGLNAAYQLNKIGLKATVYEASARTGGRMFTINNKFGAGITTDIGGEYVDITHTDIIELVKELNLGLYDLREDGLASQTFYFAGKLITAEELGKAILPFAKRIEKDVALLPDNISYNNASAFQHLDKMSITEYITGLGIKGWLFNFLDLVLTREYGMEASQQSAVNFLIMFTGPQKNDTQYELFGEEHEVLKIKGGSQNLTNKIHEKIQAQVVLNQVLVSIKKNKSGYALGFTERGKAKSIIADYVVLAIPFTVLRKVTFNVPMPVGKRKCIDELGYGNSGKFILGFNTKPWRTAGQKGYTYTDLEFGCGWDSSLMQSEKEGSFSIFGGGEFMNQPCTYDSTTVAQQFLPQLEEIYKGTQQAYNGKNVNFCWSKNPHSQAAYSAFKIGQWSTLAGWEAMPVENIYFAGEHTSPQFQGYMNGAAQTGRLAAEAIAKAIIANK